jgi:hypothetical protein
VQLDAGAIIGIDYRGVRHEGIVSEPGTEDSARVVHSSKRTGRVVEEDGATFRAGRQVRQIAVAPHPAASIGYARACVGRPWQYANNCQTFTREIAGVSIPSRDASRVAWLAVGACAFAAALRVQRRAVR